MVVGLYGYGTVNVTYTLSDKIEIIPNFVHHAYVPLAFNWGEYKHLFYYDMKDNRSDIYIDSYSTQVWMVSFDIENYLTSTRKKMLFHQ